ncbi:MAG TPA: GNAT family N-acetyltransferase [Micromonosporaceae bacterium]
METRDLDPDHLDAAFDIRTRSFGPLGESRRENWRRMMLRAIAERRLLGCYDGPRIVAMARINRFRQWWHGRTLPMAGVGGVVVAPEHRGRGIGTRLMLATLDRAAELGYPISVLYPATVPPYRGLGWEFGGAQYLVSAPAEALRGLATAPIPLRRVGPDDAPEILSVVRRLHAAARSSGPIDWDESEVRTWLAEDQPFSYLAEDGFLVYHWEDQDLEVDELVAGSISTARALWSLVGSGSPVATTVKACIGPMDPLRWLTREAVVRPAEEKRWMLRLVDVPAALAGRGYPAGLDVEVSLEVDDPQRPGNTAAWRLTVTKGTGRVEPVTSRPAASLQVGPRGIAALYSGTPLATLRVAGLASGGDPDTDAVLDTVFGGNPYLLDYF